LPTGPEKRYDLGLLKIYPFDDYPGSSRDKPLLNIQFSGVLPRAFTGTDGSDFQIQRSNPFILNLRFINRAYIDSSEIDRRFTDRYRQLKGVAYPGMDHKEKSIITV